MTTCLFGSDQAKQSWMLSHMVHYWLTLHNLAQARIGIQTIAHESSGGLLVCPMTPDEVTLTAQTNQIG